MMTESFEGETKTGKRISTGSERLGLVEGVWTVNVGLVVVWTDSQRVYVKVRNIEER